MWRQYFQGVLEKLPKKRNILDSYSFLFPKDTADSLKSSKMISYMTLCLYCCLISYDQRMTHLGVISLGVTI